MTEAVKGKQMMDIEKLLLLKTTAKEDKKQAQLRYKGTDSGYADKIDKTNVGNSIRVIC